MVSLGVVSLFTRVPIRKTISLLSPHFDDEILRLLRHVLNASNFSFAGQFYEQIDGVAMGSPLSPVITDFFMMDFARSAGLPISPSADSITWTTLSSSCRTDLIG
jgi:hypothetical protein